VRTKLEDACKKTAGDPEFAAAMKLQGTHARFLDSKQYAEFFKKNDQVNKDISRDLGLLKR
jgi:tripartite-type tricarboxylate transporter receptor subunit TctC